MPKRTDLHKILIIGSGPIVIGQACEFDYSGTQACKALRQEGYEIVLVNSNPATIMTDPETADVTYIEPLTVASVTEIIRRERPDALLPTVGGQTALNLAIALEDAGVLREYNVEMIGANRDAIKVAENRLLFKQAMDEAGLEMPRDERVRRARGLTRAVLARNPVRWLTAQLRDLDVARGIASQRPEELEEPEGAVHLNIGDLDEAFGRP